MAASPEETPGRRRRYTRQDTDGLVAMTPNKIALLQHVAECRIASLPQLALLADLSPKATRNHLRVLFDAGLVDVVPVPRVALAAPDAPNDAQLLYGSAPNIYMPTKDGVALLRTHGLLDKALPVRAYGPKNSLFLAHELLVRDVRVWLVRCARVQQGHALESWIDGPEAAIDLPAGAGIRQVQPDARFIYRLGDKVLVGFVEVDRGTERGGTRWLEKLEAYAALFAGDTLRDAIGYRNARVLVITTDADRRDSLASLIADSAVKALATRFWLAGNNVLNDGAFATPAWRVGESVALASFIP